MIRPGAAAVVLALALAGCSETASILSTPPGARVSINGRALGVTPVELSVDRWDFQEPYRFLVEKDGYVSQEGILVVRARPGRVVGTVLTYGALAAFQKPATFESPVVLKLEPTVCTRAQEQAIRAAGLRQTSVDVVCVRPAAGPPRVIAPVSCRPEQKQAMAAAGLTEDQARSACGE